MAIRAARGRRLNGQGPAGRRPFAEGLFATTTRPLARKRQKNPTNSDIAPTECVRNMHLRNGKVLNSPSFTATRRRDWFYYCRIRYDDPPTLLPLRVVALRQPPSCPTPQR